MRFFFSDKTSDCMIDQPLGSCATPKRGLVPNNPCFHVQTPFLVVHPFLWAKNLYYSLCCSHPILCRFSGAFCWYRTLAGQPAYSCGWETSSLLKSPVPVDTQRVRANASSKRRLMLYFWLRSEGPVVGEGKIMIRICHGLIRNSVLNFKDKLVSQSINSDKLDPPNHGIPYKKRETSRSPDSGTPAWLKILDPHHGTTPT